MLLQVIPFLCIRSSQGLRGCIFMSAKGFSLFLGNGTEDISNCPRSYRPLFILHSHNKSFFFSFIRNLSFHILFVHANFFHTSYLTSAFSINHRNFTKSLDFGDDMCCTYRRVVRISGFWPVLLALLHIFLRTCHISFLRGEKCQNIERLKACKFIF